MCIWINVDFWETINGYAMDLGPGIALEGIPSLAETPFPLV